LNIVKRNILIALSGLFALLIISFLLYLNDIIISIRINDIRNYLTQLDISERNIDHITLIATYEIHKKMYEERITQDAADALENKIAALSGGTALSADKPKISRHFLTSPALMMINFNRRVLGKKAISFAKEKPLTNEALNKAYYLERNMLFKDAAVQYAQALEMSGLSNSLKAGILLRQGYCYALSGENEKAMRNYRTITQNYSQESSAITASILSRYLEGFIIARKRVLTDDRDSIGKGRKLLTLLAYEQALEIIETEAKSATSAQDLAQIEYFKARCYSGIGEPQRAVESYIKSITADPASPYAKYSNRKLYLIGTNKGGDNVIVKTAKQINEKLNDPVLTESIRENESRAAAQSIADTRTQNAQTESSEINDLQQTLTPITVTIPEKLIKSVEKVTSGEKIVERSEAPAQQGPKAASYLVIRTSDGSTFRGTLLQKSVDTISIQTSIGRVDIKKDKIIEMTEKE